MASRPVRGSSISQALSEVNKAAQADTHGVGQAHFNFLESIRNLTLVVEKPGETLMRNHFEVGNHETLFPVTVLVKIKH